MEYTLENLQRLIMSVSPEAINTKELSQNSIDNWIIEITKEKNAIQLQLMKDIFNIQQERTLEIYVSTCQLTLISFADTLTSYTNQITKRSKLKVLYEEILFIVDSILTFIEHHFSKYFNLDTKVPGSYFQVAQFEMKRNIKSLKNDMGKLNIDMSLFKIACQPFEDFINDSTTNGITYWKLIYLKDLFIELNDFTKSEISKPNSQGLIDLLFYLNFNDLFFFNYFIDWVCTEIENINSITERIEKLSFYIKSINQSHYRPGVSLYKDYPHIKEQVISWLTEEIYFLEKKHQLTLSVSLPKIEYQKCEPVYTSMSVSQLGFFIKLLVDTGVLNNKNQTELLKTISSNVRTHRNESISIDSLRNKYYNVDKSTTEAIKDKLFVMINQVKKYS